MNMQSIAQPPSWTVAQFDTALTAGERWTQGMQAQGARPVAAPVRRYATYLTFDGEALYGTAELLAGYGWLFRGENGWMEVCSPHDVLRGVLELHGLCALADAQLAEDLALRTAGLMRCAQCGQAYPHGEHACPRHGGAA